MKNNKEAIERSNAIAEQTKEFNGICTTSQQKSINIVKMNDGSVRKVLRK